MPRPKKWRKVCCLPDNSQFAPVGHGSGISLIRMTVDEYEAIRLIDLEGLKQEQCAEQMAVARTTVQGIYENARHKIADAIVNGKKLIIEGGDITLCGEQCDKTACRRRHRGCTGNKLD